MVGEELRAGWPDGASTGTGTWLADDQTTSLHRSWTRDTARKIEAPDQAGANTKDMVDADINRISSSDSGKLALLNHPGHGDFGHARRSFLVRSECQFGTESGANHTCCCLLLVCTTSHH